MPFFLINDVPIDCINQAAITYHVPAKMILSVLRAENGRNGVAKPNRNGTIDYGPMQVNSVWLKKLKFFGYSANDLQFNPCKNVEVGTWILSKAMANNSLVLNGIGDYHSHNLSLNKNYSANVIKEYKLINSIL